MKIHEFQAKELLREYLLPVPEGRVAQAPSEVAAIVASLGKLPVAVKSQIHSSGRGRGGGIQLAATFAEAQRLAALYLGMPLVTEETGPAGAIVRRVLIEEAKEVAQELYLALLPDQARAEVAILAGVSGGRDLAEVAARTPERLAKVGVNPLLGLQPYHCRALAAPLQLAARQGARFAALVRQCYRLFVDYDCLLLEINPLVLTPAGEFFALDAKIEFDPRALARHPELLAYRDAAGEDPLAAEAARSRLNYAKLAGTIGTMANGAGLAMTTLDQLRRAGGEAANLVDLGSAAEAEAIGRGLRLLVREPGVRGVLINIFGGLLRCDLLARSLVAAVGELALPLPIVVRLEGTNVVAARRILGESGLNLRAVSTLAEATRLVVALAAAEPAAAPAADMGGSNEHLCR